MERGTSKKNTETCPRCKEDFTPDILKKVYKNASNAHLIELSEALNKYKDVFKLDTCARKAHFFAQSREEAGLSLIPGLQGENMNYSVQGAISTFGAFQTEEGKKKAQELGRKSGESALGEEQQKKVAEYAYGYQSSKGKELGNKYYGDGWNFRGRGLFQITGRYNYNEIQNKINAFASDSEVDLMKKYDKPDTVISTEQGGMSSKEAAVSALVDWFKDNMYVQADQTGKLSDDQVVGNIVDKINKFTTSRAKRIVHYRGGSATSVIPNKNKTKVSYTATKDKNGNEKDQPTKDIFKVSECGKTEESLKFIEGTWHDPVDNPQITMYMQSGGNNERYATFGDTRFERKRVHQGVDLFALDDGETNIYACLSGVISFADVVGGYGNLISIEISNPEQIKIFNARKRNYILQYKNEGEKEYGNGYKQDAATVYLRYAHLSKMLVKKGDKVTVGQVIGTSGTTGVSDGTCGPHLHFEIATYDGGKGINNRVNPAFYVYYKYIKDMTKEELKIQEARKNKGKR